MEKDKKRLDNKRYREDHRAEIAEKNRAYRKAHPEIARAAASRYAKAHPEKVNARNKAYREANPEKFKAWGKKRREANGESIKARKKLPREAEANRKRARKWAEEHRVESGAKAKEWREKNKDRYREALSNWYQEHRAEAAEKGREYRRTHPEVMTAARVNRRARISKSTGRHTAEDIKQLFESQNKKCASLWCRVNITPRGKNRYHVDHVMPLALGGSNGPDNLQLLCATCNCKKNAKHPDDWAKDNGLLFI